MLPVCTQCRAHRRTWCVARVARDSQHRDIKPENLLLSDPMPDAVLKLCDMGLARSFDHRQLIHTVCGTHRYLAPELVRCDRGEQDGYTCAVDMWGVGLILFIVLFGHNPFHRREREQTLAAIANCDWHFPPQSTVSAAARALIRSMLLPYAPKRITASDAMRHKWFTTPDEPPSVMAIW